MLKKTSFLLFILIFQTALAQTPNDDITQESFRAMTEKFKLVMSPLVANIGKKFVLDLRVNDGNDRYLVKAEADVRGRQAIVRLFGGMARHELINLDGLTLILCHELGHHLAGPPIRRADYPWSSAEGQADYWATKVCAKKMWKDEAWMIPSDTHPKVLAACKDDAVCIRSMRASQTMINVLKSMRRMHQQIDFDVLPATPRVSSTFRDHPGIACRFKTLIGGVLCQEDENCERLDLELFSAGRPACWYQP